MTSAFLPFPPLFQWPSNEGFDYSFQYYYYHDSRKNGHSRHLWDEGFLEQDCGTNDGAMTYPPGTAIDNQLGTYLTNYIVTGLALVGAIFVYRQVVTIRRRRPPIPFTSGDHPVPNEGSTSTTNYAFFCIQRRQAIIWFLLWFALSYGAAGFGHQFRTNEEPGQGHFDSDFAWTARISYASTILSFPGLIMGMVSNTWLTCGGISEEYDMTTATTMARVSLQRQQQRRYLGTSLLWLTLALAGAIYIFLADVGQIFSLTGFVILLGTIGLIPICFLAAIMGGGCGLSTQQRSNKEDTHSENDGAVHSSSPIGEIDGHPQDKKEEAAASFSSLNRRTSFIFAMSQVTIAVGIAIQAVLTPVCGSKEAYQECFVDCPLSYTWNHNFIYHIFHGAGILLIIAGALLLPR
jgi:hypothetical protein